MKQQTKIERRNQRVLHLADCMISEKTTVRGLEQIAREGGYSVKKSTIHRDLTYILKPLDPQKYRLVQAILQKNKNERHLRGGLATKTRYAKA